MITSKKFIIIEFILLCIVIPGILIFGRLAPFMFAFLWGATLYGFFIYRKYYFESFKAMWAMDQVTWENMKPILIRWVLASLGMLVFIYFYDPERMFYILNHRPEIIPGLMIGYPIISALPQEFVFCTFFFARYAVLFGSDRNLIIASMITFAYAHILYINPVAPVLSLAGGLIFALTYARTRSLALVTIEHGLYGNSLFLIGLGWYFYSGSVASG